MKKLFTILLASCLFVCFSNTSYSQFSKLRQKIKDKVNQRADDKEDKAIDKTLDDAENSTKKNGNGDSNPDGQSDNNSSGKSSATQTIKSYQNYDFVPGDQIIFESDLANEETGEIPSQFTLSDGQMDVQQEDGENVIHVAKGPGTTFTPRMTKETYMPDQFTIEFDVKNERFGVNHFSVDFGNRVYHAQDPAIMPGIEFDDASLTWTLGGVDFPVDLHADGSYPMIWHHIAIAINKNVGKVYVDQYRVANVNNLTGKPNNVTLHIDGYEASFLKNVRIAKGGIDIYKESTTPAKIVMHGILFDVDKATLKPESMGSINEIYKLMKKNLV